MDGHDEREADLDLTPTLIAHLREGRAGAGQLLDRMYRERLIGFCLGYLGDRDRAEDVVQDVFVRVLRSDAVPGSFRAWIYRICRNRCLDVNRNLARRRDDRPLPAPSLLRAQTTGHLTRLVRGERHERLRELMRELPAEQHEVLLLRYGEGLSRLEIAEVLGIPEKLVKSRLFHGLEKLRLHDSLADGV